MEYNRVTAILLILLGMVSATGVAKNGASMGTVAACIAVVATMVTVLGAGLAWTKGSPWMVLGLIAAAALATWLASVFDDHSRRAGMILASVPPEES